MLPDRCQAYYADRGGLYCCVLPPGHINALKPDGTPVQPHQYDRVDGKSGTWVEKRDVLRDMGMSADDIAAAKALSSRRPGKK